MADQRCPICPHDLSEHDRRHGCRHLVSPSIPRECPCGEKPDKAYDRLGNAALANGIVLRARCLFRLADSSRRRS